MTNFKKILLGAASLMIVATVAIADGGVPADLEKGSVSGVQPTAQSVVVSVDAQVAAVGYKIIPAGATNAVVQALLAQQLADGTKFTYPELWDTSDVMVRSQEGKPESYVGYYTQLYDITRLSEGRLLDAMKYCDSLKQLYDAQVAPATEGGPARYLQSGGGVSTGEDRDQTADVAKLFAAVDKYFAARKSAVVAARDQSSAASVEGFVAAFTQIDATWETLRAVHDQVKLVNAGGHIAEAEQSAASAAIDGLMESFYVMQDLHSASGSYDNHDVQAVQLADLKTKIAAVKPYIRDEDHDRLLDHIAQLETALTNYRQLHAKSDRVFRETWPIVNYHAAAANH